jgi:hypothetical protein
MTIGTIDESQRKSATVVGLSYLFALPPAIFAGVLSVQKTCSRLGVKLKTYLWRANASPPKQSAIERSTASCQGRAKFCVDLEAAYLFRDILFDREVEKSRTAIQVRLSSAIL